VNEKIKKKTNEKQDKLFIELKEKQNKNKNDIP